MTPNPIRPHADKAVAARSAALRRRKVSAPVREACLNFHREATGEPMPETSLRAYAESRLATKKNAAQKGTMSSSSLSSSRAADGT
jgi:hypothetical protein